jgi:ABC-2 type transport system permease protein
MRKILLIARRDYRAAVRTKGFIIGLLLAPIMMFGSLIVIGLTRNRVDVTDQRLAVVDRSGVLGEALADAARQRNDKDTFDKTTGKKILPRYLVEIEPPENGSAEEQRLRLSEKVRSGRLHAFVEIAANVLESVGEAKSPRIAYYSKSPALDDTRRWLAGPINSRLQQVRLAKAGFTSPALGRILARETVDGMNLVSRDPKTGEIGESRRAGEAEAVLTPMALMLMMFMMLMMGAMPLLSAVMEEKTSRISEVLLGVVTPFEFMFGKVLGGVGVSLTASSFYVAAAILGLGQMSMESVIPYGVLPWFFAFMLLAVLTNGATMAALGSMCSNNKDAQSLAGPAMIPLLIPMFLMIPVIREPQRAIWAWLSFFPPFTPTLMVLRQAAPAGVPVWQPLVALILVMLYTVFVVWAGGRVFRMAILMQGQPPHLAKVFRWIFKG